MGHSGQCFDPDVHCHSGRSVVFQICRRVNFLDESCCVPIFRISLLVMDFGYSSMCAAKNRENRNGKGAKYRIYY